MSGGSMNYLYGRIEDFSSYLCDDELERLAADFAKVFHDAEWWYSSDICEQDYRKTVKEFKEKWLHRKNNKSPSFDRSGMDAIVDSTMMLFEIDESKRTMLQILFDAYVSQYMKQTCHLSWNFE